MNAHAPRPLPEPRPLPGLRNVALFLDLDGTLAAIEPRPEDVGPEPWRTELLLQGCLGVRIDGWTSEITIDHPSLPIGIDSLVIDNLRVGSADAHLLFQHAGERVIAVPGRRCDPGVAVITRA